MEILNLKTNSLNQNNYSVNKNTPDFIGSLVIYPVDVLPDKCLPCDGFKLKISDYELLHKVIGKKYNDGTELIDEFRIPNYNITKRFLQPGNGKFVGNLIEAGLPDHNHTVSAFYWNYPGVAEEGRGNPDYGNHLALKTNNASVSNPIYGRSKTVQPPSQVVHVCIRYK